MVESKIKVLHIFKTYFPDTQGGLEEAIRQIARYNSNHGIENRIMTVSPIPIPRIVRFQEATVVRYKTLLDVFSTPISLEFFHNFKKNISTSDILHFHFPWPWGELNFLCSNEKKPSLVTYHSDIVKHKYMDKLYSPFSRLFLKKVDLIIATSEQYIESSAILKPIKEKCRVIPLSIDDKRFKGIDDNIVQTIKNKYGEDFFLFVGVLRSYKGLCYLLDAMVNINRQLVIVGKGPEENKLKEKAKSLNLNNVIFTGFVDDKYLPAFYKLCRAFVFPSSDRSEAFGVSLLEASFFSKPMISTELGTGTTLVNKHNETGLVVSPNDAIELRNSLSILSRNKQICEKYGRNARKRFDKLFNSESIGEKYLDIYKQLYERQHKMRK
jgi:glycosyltransferase involved in cell wall biosynthesis